MESRNLCINSKELIGFLVVLGCVVNNYAIAVPQNEFFNACLKCQATARCTIRLAGVGKIPIIINSHKVKRRALKLAGTRIDSSEATERTARSLALRRIQRLQCVGATKLKNEVSYY